MIGWSKTLCKLGKFLRRCLNILLIDITAHLTSIFVWASGIMCLSSGCGYPNTEAVGVVLDTVYSRRASTLSMNSCRVRLLPLQVMSSGLGWVPLKPGMVISQTRDRLDYLLHLVCCLYHVCLIRWGLLRLSTEIFFKDKVCWLIIITLGLHCKFTNSQEAKEGQASSGS